MTWIALIALLIAIILFWVSTQQRKHSGLPGGRVIYTDTRAWGKPVEKPLYDPVLGLTGKPDYLVQQGNQVIPVEVKSSNVSDAPYDSHILQLAAYCMLVEHSMHKRPRYGILHYPKRSFAIDFTPALEAAVMQVLVEMQSSRKDIPRTHNAPQRCARCGFRSVCDQALRI